MFVAVTSLVFLMWTHKHVHLLPTHSRRPKSPVINYAFKTIFDMYLVFILAGHFVLNRCDFFTPPYFYCSFKSGCKCCGLSVISWYSQVDKMLKIMIELSSTYENFQRARTLTHAHTAQHIRCRHAPLLCTMHKHTSSCWCHDMTFETHIWKCIEVQKKRVLYTNKRQTLPVAHLRWLRWCPSVFSAHYITNFWFGRGFSGCPYSPTCKSF